MTTSLRPSLDPRKTPWKRGDVCTLGFKRHCFVLNHTSSYLEVRWMGGGGVERLTGLDIENLLRVGHADDLDPTGKRTNLESCEAIEALSGVEEAVQRRVETIKDESERQELDRLVRRIFATDRCRWDEKHQGQLYLQLVSPRSASLIFRICDYIHVRFCKKHER